ncbi:MAG: SDR family NAD(P)-dependent oxidoreductase, partial [Candidatus Kariarchaeaceae archaeon]
TLAVNYFATFLLTNLLIDLIANSDDGRIINLTSELYKNGKIELNKSLDKKFNGNNSYAESKKLVVYFTQSLSSKVRTVTANCLHPGMIASDFIREYPRILGKSINFFLPKPKSGAKHVVHLATSLELKGVTGKYFSKNNEKEVKEENNHEKLLEEIWNYSKRMTKLEDIAKENAI